jgi:hypothetical protein
VLNPAHAGATAEWPSRLGEWAPEQLAARFPEWKATVGRTQDKKEVRMRLKHYLRPYLSSHGAPARARPRAPLALTRASEPAGRAAQG